MEQGKIFKFHNDLDTDQIIASQYLLLPNLDEMKGHAFESLDPDFAKKVKPGDFVVGGENFGCGSSREQAPGVLKALGVQAVIAKSFARIFFRIGGIAPFARRGFSAIFLTRSPIRPKRAGFRPDWLLFVTVLFDAPHFLLFSVSGGRIYNWAFRFTLAFLAAIGSTHQT